MRTLVLLLTLVCVVSPAEAETELAVLGPVGDASNKDLQAVATVLDRGEAGPRNARSVDAACFADAACLATTGAELGTRRVLAVTMQPRAGAQLVVQVALVDVGSKDLIVRRNIAAKAAKDLGPALKKLVDEAPVERAKALFASGNQHYNLGEFDQALEAYKLAYRIKPLPAFLFNIAQCHRKLGQHKEAVAMYQSYLVGIPDAQNKPLVESLIAESRTEIANEEAKAREAEELRMSTEKQKAEEMRRAKEAEARAAAERAKAEQVRIDREREIYDRHPTRVPAIVGGAVGIAAIGVGAYFAVSASDHQDAFDGAGCGDLGRQLGAPVLAQCVEDRDAGKRDALYANILLGSGAALVVTSALLFLIDPGNVERPEQRTVSVGVSPSSVNLMVRW